MDMAYGQGTFEPSVLPQTSIKKPQIVANRNRSYNESSRIHLETVMHSLRLCMTAWFP